MRRLIASCNNKTILRLPLGHASLPCRMLRALLRHRNDLVDGCLHRVFPGHLGGKLMGGLPK